jgi:hypothetical protein
MPAAGAEECGNCQDDDADGLVDAEDPDCCDPQALAITLARERRRSRLQVKGRLAPGVFAGLDPRQADVQVQMRDVQGEVVCCSVPREQWKKVLGRTYWFRDRQGICSALDSLCLIVPKRGSPTRTVINTGGRTPSMPLDITLSAGGKCVQGEASSVRSRARSRPGVP